MALVHKFKQGEEYIVLDVNSGAVHVVDELVYDIIEDEGLEEKEVVLKKLEGKYPAEVISEAYDEIEELVKEDMLYSKDQYEDIAHNSMDDADYIKAVCLNIIHD